MAVIFKFLLSYWDQLLGPRTIMDLPQDVDQGYDVTEVHTLFDIYNDNEFFTHFYRGYVTMNLIFSVENKEKRGSKMRFMLTVSLLLATVEKKQDFLFYYNSFVGLFKNWVTMLTGMPNFTASFIDGSLEGIAEGFEKPLSTKIHMFIEEFDYILSSMPDRG